MCIAVPSVVCNMEQKHKDEQSAWFHVNILQVHFDLVWTYSRYFSKINLKTVILKCAMYCAVPPSLTLQARVIIVFSLLSPSFI